MDEKNLNNDPQINEEKSANKIINVEIAKEMKDSYIDYSMSVIVSRALPDVRDGLKPVHRRILYAMYSNGLTPDKPYSKSAETVGSTLGKYHPHGDSSIYDALVRLAQDFSMRYILVDGQGNFGSIDGDSAAAYRYTEARLSRISTKLLLDIDKETVDFKPNFDDKHIEPVVLPSKFPNLIVNGSSGIAVGMATNIPPHNLGEVIDALCALIDNKNITDLEIMEYIKGPDFPTGALIMGTAGIRAAYKTGRGRIVMRARTEIEETKPGLFSIIVTELPYQVNKAKLVESIANLVKDKRIEQIKFPSDESDRDGMRIVIPLKKDANAQVVLNQLFSFTQLQETFSTNLLALVDGIPKVVTLLEMLRHYLEFQFSVITRRTQFELKKAVERVHILEALKIVIDFYDEVSKIIRTSETVQDGKNSLMERFNMDDIQASAIMEMRMRQLTGLESKKIEDEFTELTEKSNELKSILTDDSKIYNIIKTEVMEIRTKYADPRRTEIMPLSGEVDIEDLIPNEECVLTFTHYGYIKRQPSDTYKSQRRGGRGISGMNRRDDDFVEQLFVCQSHDYILFFTNQGRIYRIKAYEIAEGSRISRGINIVNILSLEPDEKISAVIKTNDFTEKTYFVIVTKNGVIKRVQATQYSNLRKNGLITIKLNDGDEVAWVKQTNGNNELMIATKNGMALKFNENCVRAMGRSAYGVKAMKLQNDDQIIGMVRIRENGFLLTITDRGQGRLTNPSDYRLQNRGGFGVRNYKVNEEKGYVAGIKIVDQTDDIIMISGDGVIIRIDAAEINLQSRYGTGVKVMRLSNPDDRVVTLARAQKEDEDEDDAEIITETESESESETESET